MRPRPLGGGLARGGRYSSKKLVAGLLLYPKNKKISGPKKMLICLSGLPDITVIAVGSVVVVMIIAFLYRGLTFTRN